MFKVVINDGSSIPDDKILYIVSKDGIYLKKKVGIVESITRVKGISFLNEIKPYAKLHIPKIPSRTFGRIITFFRKVYEVHKTECNAILYYNEKTQKFRVKIPPQETTGGGVKYLRIPAMEGYVRLSTIHSHPSFTAFHSGTDVGDEKDSDGLHITVGRITEPMFEIVASVVVGGTRFKVSPEDYIAGIQKTVMQEQSLSVVHYVSPYLSKLLEESATEIPTFTNFSTEERYKFVKWNKKFERYNPKWLFMVKPAKNKYLTWTEDLDGLSEVKHMTVNDLFPQSSDVKTQRKEVEIKEFNPCIGCAFKTFKERETKKELTGDNHGSQ